MRETIDGQGFVETSLVQWNGTALQTAYVSNSILNAVLPGTDFGTNGTASLTVNNPSPGGGTSNTVSFTIAPLAPLSSFSSSTINFPGQPVGIRARLRQLPCKIPEQRP